MKNSDFKVRCEPPGNLVISLFIRLWEFCYGWTRHVESADSHHGRLVSGAYESYAQYLPLPFPQRPSICPNYQ
jgi:hypothetical protein